MQSLRTTELLSFHPPLLETGVSVGIAPPKIGTYHFPRQQLPGVVHAIFTCDDVLPWNISTDVGLGRNFRVFCLPPQQRVYRIKLVNARRFTTASPAEYY